MRVVVIAGPTASGKSDLAIDLALRLDGEIVNADSQQVYRGLDAGTAKPTRAMRTLVPHHLFDVVDPGGPMDAARYQALADAALAGIRSRGKVAMVAGGTGLYLRALLRGVAPAPGRDPELRATLEAEASREGRVTLHRRLAEVDPESAAKIGQNDLVRIVRALEIAASGQTQSEIFAAHRFAEKRYDARYLVLDVPRAELNARIDRRVPQLFETGFLAEARQLLEQSGGALPARLPIGYAEAAAVLKGSLELSEAVERVRRAHRQYARRQVIWFRREPNVEWLPVPVDVDRLAADLSVWLNSR